MIPREPATVNDLDELGVCWICADPTDHDGRPHSEATGDGLTRYAILDRLDALAQTRRAS